MDKQKYVSSKIKKIKDDGIRGKKVGNKQAVAVALQYYKDRHK